MPPSDDLFILLPVKKLTTSKTRLSPVLSPEERSRLTLLMLEDVIKSVSGQQNAFVVTGDQTVGTFAIEHGLGLIESGLGDLNADLVYARTRCIAAGASSILFLLPDLPTLSTRDIEGMIELGRDAPSAVVAPSRDGGTNALLLSPCDLIEPAFGYMSLERHVRELRAVSVEPSVYSSLGTELDIDTPEDARILLEIGGRFCGGARALSYLKEIGESRLGGVL